MTFDDFCTHFVNMSICHRVNTSALSLQKRWRETLIDGEWTTPNRAGGCSNNKATFFNNPQVTYRNNCTPPEKIVYSVCHPSADIAEFLNNSIENYYYLEQFLLDNFLACKKLSVLVKERVLAMLSRALAML
jgi:hypothetical protein